MIPSTNSPPPQSETYTESYSVSEKGCHKWQTVEPRQRCPQKSTDVPKEGADLGSPSGGQRSLRASVSEQQEVLLKKGFELLQKKPGESLQIARELLKTVPNAVGGHALQARALACLGRYEECYALLDRLPSALKQRITLRKTRARVLAEMCRFHEAEAELRDLYANHSHTQQHKKTNGLALGRVLERMGGKKEQEALEVFTQVRQCLATQPDSPCDDMEVELTLVRHLQKMGGRGHLQRALDILICLRRKKADNRPDTPCNNVKIEMNLARALQQLGASHLQKAYTIWLDLYQQTPHNREIELGFAICLSKMATTESRQEALTLMTALRQRAAGNRVDTACDDKEIEVTLAKLLQDIGGSRNREQALAILLRLRQQAARGRPDTPCCDRGIELALGGHWQLEGGHENQQKALAIFTELRQRAGSGRADTPSNDREVEVALAILLSQMGGPENQHKALAILTHLRTLAGSKDRQTPCDNQDIEFPIAICLKESHDWQAFDRWNRQRPRFEDVHQLELILSTRYFREFLMEDTYDKPRPDLLEKAFRHVQRAVDDSDQSDPSSLSQLGHCYRALSHCTSAVRQQLFGQQASAAQIGKRSRDCFDTAARLDPDRRGHHKEPLWHEWEQAWRDQVKPPSCDLANETDHPQLCQQPAVP